jgi:uncharacterized membrane protein YfcA
MITTLLLIIILLHICSAAVLARDLRANWRELFKEPGRLLVQAPVSFLLNFLSGFGVSDYVICTALYHKTGWAEPRKLPGTLNTQSTLPVLVFALAYLSSVQVDIRTLLPLLAADMLGAFLSPRLTMSLPVRRIRQILACGLLFAGCAILANKLELVAVGGQATSLQGFKLAAGVICYFIIGALKAMGVASYPLAMTATFFLGLHPLVSYPLMMGGGALAAPLILIRYVKLDGYMRKLTLLGATVGVAGGAIAVFTVKTLDISLLQWLVVGVVFYAATDILLTLRRARRAEQNSG